MALNNAITWLNGYKEVYQTTDGEMAAVLVFRHKGLPVALNDDMWARLNFGDDDKLKDPTTGEPTKRNPFINGKAADKNSTIMPEGGVEELLARGAIVLACNQAPEHASGGRPARKGGGNLA